MALQLNDLMPQQREVVTTFDRPLFVSAGAGSGKTFTLTQRILYALSPESGPAIDSLSQVLAITFTKDAAAEIRDRVRSALIAAGMEREALDVDEAWISTIHGMCSRILRAHALEIGIDPEFSVVEEADASLLMDRAIDTVLARSGVVVREGDEQSFAERSSRYRALFARFAIRGELGPDGYERGATLHTMVPRLIKLASSLPHGFDDISIHRGSVDFSHVLDEYREVAGTTKAAAQKAHDGTAAIERLLTSDGTFEDVMACMMACDVPRANKAYPKERVELLKAYIADAVINAALSASDRPISELLAFSAEVEQEYRLLKRDQSVHDNDDLLRVAAEALRDHPDIRASYADAFKLVMVDEFQDTDQQQVDLISTFTGPGSRRLVTVGDAQQSIYRFRGAEVEVFRTQERSIAQLSQAALAASSAAAAPALQGAGTGQGFGAGQGLDTDRGSSAAGADVQDAPARGSVVRLARNFRSHAVILAYVKRVFDSEQGGFMSGFLDLESHPDREVKLVAQDASRCQALLVVGSRVSDVVAAKANAIAQRFAALARAGQPVRDMVVLLGKMTNAKVYAEAIRAAGLNCVISGGTVFANAPEVAAVRSLVRSLANPLDTAEGLVPLLTSPMFSLGAEELLALATRCDEETGEVSRRAVNQGLFEDQDAPGLGGLPLVRRAREVLRPAFARVGRDSFYQIARDVVNQSGWFARLSKQGAEGKAVAANVLKALSAIQDAEVELGNAPRRISLAFDQFLAGKQAPGALNEEDGNAVRIMTVHASKGLEYPVVAVADCFEIRKNSDRLQLVRREHGVEMAIMPSLFPSLASDTDAPVASDRVRKRFDTLRRDWLTPELRDEACASTSAAGAFAALQEENNARELEERARLLYVAMTRASEVLILAMGETVGSREEAELVFDDETDLTGRVLKQIVEQDEAGYPRLSAQRLVLNTSREGDFEGIFLRDFSYRGSMFDANAELEGVAEGDGVVSADDAAQEAPADGAVPLATPTQDGDAVRAGDVAQAAPDSLDTFTLVYPHAVRARIAPLGAPERDSYSYSSISATLHAERDDTASAVVDRTSEGLADEMGNEGFPEVSVSSEGAYVFTHQHDVLDAFAPDAASLAASALQQEQQDITETSPGESHRAASATPAPLPAQPQGTDDPTALGSAFHAAAQWLVETGSETAPDEVLDALGRTWGVSESQRVRLERALRRWERSHIRAEALSYPRVLAEVPFFSLGMEEFREEHGAYAEGAIDLLCFDPKDRARALVIDYKTGGDARETPQELQEKHALQAAVYADVLHKAGFERVSLAFVRVEIACGNAGCESAGEGSPDEPQVVRYEL